MLTTLENIVKGYFVVYLYKKAINIQQVEIQDTDN